MAAMVAREAAGRPSQGGPAEAGADDWGAGRWIKDRWGNWAWTVDFAASAAASAVPATGAPAPEVAAVAASQLVSAAVQAVLAAGAAPAAPVVASAPGVSERVRILELQLELEQFKRQRLAYKRGCGVEPTTGRCVRGPGLLARRASPASPVLRARQAAGAPAS